MRNTIFLFFYFIFIFIAGVHLALAGFSLEPDAEYKDRVFCDACGLSVGMCAIKALLIDSIHRLYSGSLI
jgi:hypothetical protein